MRLTFAIACTATVLLLTCQVQAQIKPKDENDPKREKKAVKPCRDEDGNLLPMFKLYEVAGRKWTVKRVTNQNAPGGDRFDMYFCFEVAAVYEDRATVRQTALDQAKKPTKDKPIDGDVKFDAENAKFTGPPGMQKARDESVTVPAGKFDCIAFTGGLDNAKTWVSKDYPGLVVRHADDYGTTEVIEFERFDSDKDKPKKRSVKEGEQDFSLFKTKKSWMLQTTLMKGGQKYISYTRYEVLKMTAEGCELKVTELDNSKKPIKDKPAEARPVPFSTEGAAFIDPPIATQNNRVEKLRSEKRKTIAGVMNCDVYSFRDEAGNVVTLWFGRDLPGLTVRKLIGEDGKDGIVELVEIK
ncbi:MAG: hypothetical protein KBG84_06405 [Planctomycetes bacterium]|nr:hypothetical protein [Planctomycetota bacterium]